LLLDLNEPTTVIELPIDNSGGTLILKNVYNTLNDTIRIKRLTVLHNRIRDSITYEESWYRTRICDTCVHPQTLKSKTIIDAPSAKENQKDWQSNRYITINGETYEFAPKRTIVSNEILLYHGHKKMRRWREILYEAKKTKGKPYTYFATSKVITKFCNRVELELK
jgi:hypothetical protein